MRRMSSQVAVMVATVGFALALASSAHGGQRSRIRTAPMLPAPGGFLYCLVYATSTKPIEIVASIVSDERTDVTEFSSGFRASPAATGEGVFYAEETAGSFDQGARYCKAIVQGARRRDVHISLTTVDANGVPIAVVEGR